MHRWEGGGINKEKKEAALQRTQAAEELCTAQR